jgi:hypothetical protein
MNFAQRREFDLLREEVWLKLLLVLAVTGIGGYLIFRLFVHLGRPLYLENAFREIDEQYTKLLCLAERDLDSAIERYHGSKLNNSPFPSTEEEQLEQINKAKKTRDHEREINDKYTRLRIRFSNDYKKQAESAAAYRAYLRFRLYKEEFASTAALVGTVADKSPEERVAYHQEQYEEARKIVIALEEIEKKLDALLASRERHC